MMESVEWKIAPFLPGGTHDRWLNAKIAPVTSGLDELNENFRHLPNTGDDTDFEAAITALDLPSHNRLRQFETDSPTGG